MIYVINGADAARYPKWMDEMHRLRARVFKDRLNWDVSVTDGWERDRFDDCDAMYLISVNDRGSVVGTLRLLPTTGPNMLRDVFSVLLDEGEAIESPTIWESTRFAVDLDTPPTPGRRVNRVTTDLLCGIVEVGMLAGLSLVLSVFDVHMLRVLRSAGYPPELIGKPQRIGGVLTYAGLFDVSEEAWQRIATLGNVQGRVLAEDSDRPAKAA